MAGCDAVEAAPIECQNFLLAGIGAATLVPALIQYHCFKAMPRTRCFVRGLSVYFPLVQNLRCFASGPNPKLVAAKTIQLFARRIKRPP
jgi:hypothetical protein